MGHIYLAKTSLELRKCFQRIGGEILPKKFNPGSSFSYETREVSTLKDIEELLLGLCNDPHRAIVMGKPLISSGERKAVHFEDTKCAFWFIDIDGVLMRESISATIEYCLPFLAGCSYVYAHTQSSGIKPDLRVRVICQPPYPMYLHEFQAYIRHYNDMLCAIEGSAKPLIDSSIYSREHLVFTAKPRLEDGLEDPHPNRVVYVQGSSECAKLEALPKMVEIEEEVPFSNFIERPPLIGDCWGSDAFEGENRSIYALISAGNLRTYMGEKDWENKELRTALWHEMLREKPVSPIEFRVYGDFVNLRQKDARVAGKSTKKVLALSNPDNSISLASATTKLHSTIERIINDAKPGVYVIEASMGLGKTKAAIECIYKKWLAMEEIGLGMLHADFYVPTVVMGEEAVTSAIEHKGLTAYFEYGRGQTINGVPVCTKPDTAKFLQKYVTNTAQYICRNSKGEVCSEIDNCPWQTQREKARNTTVRFCAHNFLGLDIHDERHPDYRPCNLVVIDESSFTEAMVSIKTVKLGDLIAPRLNSAEYEWVLKFASVVNQGLTIDALKKSGFTSQIFHQLSQAERRLCPNIQITPLMNDATGNKKIRSIDTDGFDYAETWNTLAECLELNSINRICYRNGALVLAKRLPIRSIPIDKNTGDVAVPVLILSGTTKREIVEQFFPKISEWHPIEVKPHPDALIIQSTLSGSKSESLYGATDMRIENGETDEKKQIKSRNVREFLSVFCKNKVLITFKELEEILGPELSAHFKAIEGLNSFSGMDVVVLGRPLPAPSELEDRARAIFCNDPRPILSLKMPWYPKRAVARRGQGYGMMEYHPDHRVDAILWTTCVGEIMQAAARCRYVRYPVRLYILNQTPLPLRINKFVPLHELEPQWKEFNNSTFLPASQNVLLAFWPKVFRHTHTTANWINRYAKQWAEDRFALKIFYRIKGKSGPMNSAYISSESDIPKLGNVSKHEYAAEPHNIWAAHAREVRDGLQREPMRDDDGEIFEPDDDDLVYIGPGNTGIPYSRIKQPRMRWPWAQPIKLSGDE